MSLVPSVEPIDTGVYISAPLGGGHVAAKNGVKARHEAECHALGHTFQVATVNGAHKKWKADIDITRFLNIGFLRFGDWSARTWNEAQKRGDMNTLRTFLLPICMKIAEFAFGWLIRLRMEQTLRHLMSEPKFVVSTQAFCLKYIAQAVRNVNVEKGWNMHLEVHLTDLPSKCATHFFPSVKSVAEDPTLRAITTLYAVPPLQKKHRSERDFWQTHCGDIQVRTDAPLPVRRTFLHPEEMGRQLDQPTFDVSIRLNDPREADGIQEGMGDGTRVNEERRDSLYQIRLKKEDKVGFLMLGSQPTYDSVLTWLKTFVQARQRVEKADGRQYYFFLICGTPGTNKLNLLFETVLSELRAMKSDPSFPKDVHIVPCTNQDETVIAPLLARSDLTITRSGGSTSMELLQLFDRSQAIPKRANRCTLIHSEASFHDDDQFRRSVVALKEKEKYSELSHENVERIAMEKQLMKEGMIPWEAKNAQYLQEKIGAHVTTPSLAADLLEEKFFLA